MMMAPTTRHRGGQFQLKSPKEVSLLDRRLFELIKQYFVQRKPCNRIATKIEIDRRLTELKR